MSDLETPKRRRPGVRPRASQACRACAAAKVRCDNLQSCRRCQNKRVACVRGSHMIESPVGSTISASSHRSLQSRQNSSRRRSQVHGPQALPLLTEAGISSMDIDHRDADGSDRAQHPTPSTELSTVLPQASTEGCENTSLPFGSFPHHDWQTNDAFDFILSSSHEWPDLGLYDYGLGEPGLDSFTPLRADSEIQETRPISEYDAGLLTPRIPGPGQGLLRDAARTYDNTLGNWNPRSKDYLAPDKAAMSIAPNIQKAMLGRMGRLDPTIISTQLSHTRRDEIVVVVAARFSTGQPLQAIPNFPSVEMLDELLGIFLTTQRESPASMIHLLTFDANSCDLWLLMACIASGAITSPKLAAHRFGLALLEVLRWHLPTMAERDNSLTRCLSFVQSFVLLADIALWSGDKRKSEISDIMSEFAMTMIRHARRLSKASYPTIVPKPNETPSQLDGTWIEWVEQESIKRTVYGHFMRCTQRAIFRNTVVIMSCTEISVPLPEHDRLWCANTAAEWAATHVELQGGEDDRRFSLGDLLSGAPSPQSLPSLQDGSLARLLTIYSLTSMLVEDRRRSRLFDTQGDSGWTSSMDTSSTAGRIALLLEDLRGAMGGDSQQEESVVEAFMLEFYGLYSTTPDYLVEALVGNERFVSANRAVSNLREWRQTRQARRAVWHAGQMFRLCRSIQPAQQTNFLVFAMYQAVLCLWMYGRACETSWPAGSPATQDCLADSPAEKIEIRLDGSESLQTQRWITHNHGIPVIAQSEDMAGMAAPDVKLIPVAAGRDPEGTGFPSSLIVALEAHFSPENSDKRFPLLVHLCQVLQALNKVYSGN